MNKYYLFTISLITFFTVANSQEDAIDLANKDQGFAYENQKYQVSIYSLIANPEDYYNKKVWVIGYAKNNFSFYLYPDKTSCEDDFDVNSLEVNYNKLEFQAKVKSIKPCEIIQIFGTYSYFDGYGKNIARSLNLGHMKKVEGIYDY